MNAHNSVWRPVEAASLVWDQHDTPRSANYDDVYYSRDNGLEESRHVFVEGNALPDRWHQHSGDCFTIGETGFGTGLNFLLTWLAWRESPQPRPRLHFISIEKSPLEAQDLNRALSRWESLAPLAKQLSEQYPGLVPGQHRLVFDRGEVILDLWWQEANAVLQDLAEQQRALFDAWYLDGFAPARNPDMWAPSVFRHLASLCRQGASFSTFTAAGHVRRGMMAAGFEVEKVPGYGRKRECLRGRLNQRPSTATLTATPWDLSDVDGSKPTRALVVGAGLAGCTVADALARRGVQVELLEQGELAGAGSGNTQGVLYTRLSHRHSPLTDFALQSFVFAGNYYQNLFDEGSLVEDRDGALCGSFHQQGHRDMLKIAERLSQVPQLARVIDAETASRLCGVPQSEAGVWFPRSGWLDPRAVCRALSQHQNVRLHESCGALTLSRSDSGWMALRRDRIVAEADCAIVAGGPDSINLAGLEWLPLQRVRGQTTHLPSSGPLRHVTAALCHEGYIAPATAGEHCIGASFHVEDSDQRARQEDHRDNLEKLANAVPAWRDMLNTLQPADLQGRVGFRCASPDYLPLVGPVPDQGNFLQVFGELRKNARRIIAAKGPHMPGLYLSTGHGSRGLTSTPLAAELLASYICSEALPLERVLCRALAPARFIIRDLSKGRS